LLPVLDLDIVDERKEFACHERDKLFWQQRFLGLIICPGDKAFTLPIILI
jgi:hypothetical protein